jgi:hemerythrin superfamily protein
MKKFASIVKILRLDARSQAIEDRLYEIHRRLESHNIVEETEIYPLVDELPEDVRYELIRRIQAELENAPPRFSEAGWRVT